MVIAEYIWIGGNDKLRSKTKVLPKTKFKYEDNNIDVSVKLPDIDDVLDEDMINEALDEVEKELTKGKNYDKNKKKREKIKQLKKGNKIKDDEPPNEDVD